MSAVEVVADETIMHDDIHSTAPDATSLAYFTGGIELVVRQPATASRGATTQLRYVDNTQEASCSEKEFRTRIPFPVSALAFPLTPIPSSPAFPTPYKSPLLVPVPSG